MMTAHNTNVRATISMIPSGHSFPVLEHVPRQLDPERGQPLAALRTNPRGTEMAAHLAVAAERGALEQEDVLHRHHLTFHAGHFGNRGHLAGPVRQTRDLDDEVDGRRGLLADGP